MYENFIKSPGTLIANGTDLIFKETGKPERVVRPENLQYFTKLIGSHKNGLKLVEDPTFASKPNLNTTLAGGAK